MMKLTKQQNADLSHQARRAAVEALQVYFMGSSATSRRLLFLRRALLASAAWTAKLLFVCSWAVIGGLLVGPEHDFLLKQVHAWMVATPVNQVLSQTHAMFMSVAVECMKAGVVLGLGQELLAIVKLAIDRVTQSFFRDLEAALPSAL